MLTDISKMSEKERVLHYRCLELMKELNVQLNIRNDANRKMIKIRGDICQLKTNKKKIRRQEIADSHDCKVLIPNRNG